MPRFAKESDEETDVKSVAGRKTRAHVEAALLDSPLRRSARNKSKQNESSPDSPVNDTGNVQIGRIKKRGISVMDNPATAAAAAAENRRTLRSRINSMSSDINELAESDTGTPTRKTRNNASNDTNKINTRRSKCFTRAGSETKSPPATRARRNTRASSIEPEAMTSSKFIDKHQNELISTPVKTRRRASALPSETTVLEEKECKKIAVVTLDRTLSGTLSNVIETKETEAETLDKTPQKNESLSTSRNKFNASQKSIDEKHLEDNVQESYNNSPENLSSNSSNSVKDVEKNVSADDKEISDNDKNVLESSETSVEVELVIDDDDDSEKKDTSTETDLKLGDSNNSMEKHDSHSNTENLTTNIVTDIQETKNATFSAQTSKSLSVSDEETGKYSSIETNLSPKRHHSKQLLEMSNENVSIKKVNNDSSGTVYLSITSSDVSMDEGDKSDNLQKLIVNTETESIISSPSSESLDKTTCIQVSISSSSNDCIEIVKHTKDVNTVNDNTVNKSVEIGTELNETSEEIRINEGKENVDVKMNTSNVKKDMNENKSEKNDTSQCVISDQCDVEKKNDDLNISEDVHKKHETSCTKLIAFPKSSNINSPNSTDVKLISDTQCSIVSKHENIHCSQKNEIDNLLSDNSLLNSSDTRTNPKDSVLNNINEVDVSNVIKSSNSSIVTETPAELVEEISKREEHSKKVTAVDDFTDSVTLKKQCKNKLELSEERSDVNRVMSEECQENMKIDDDESDTNMTNVFQDILASEWKEKDSDTNKKPIHLNSTENESEGECDLILVDREAWLAAENLKTNKETNTFDYDSDDTVISKAFTDFMKAQKNETNKLMDTLKEECNLNDSQDKSSSAKKRKIMKENNKNKNEEGNTMENTKNITQDVKMSINVDKNVSLTKNRSKNESIQKSLEDESLSESYKVGEKNLSLNEHKLSEDIPKQRKSLNKSVQETNKLEKFNEETVEKRNSLNKSNCENVLASAKKNEKDQLSNTSKKKIKPQQLNVEIAEESDNELKKAECREKQDNTTKKILNRCYSTVANFGSNSDESRNISDFDDSLNKSLKIPTFLFRGISDSSDDNSESNNSIDSDVKMEYNFDGLELPDDDVPGDECRASETESSDSNDNGSDLADFVVDDDEDEDEDEDEEGIESEEKEVDIENDPDNEQDVKEDNEKDEEKTEEIIQKKQHENCEKDKSKLMDTSNTEKNKSRKSNDLSISQIGSDQKKKKKSKIDTSQTKDGSILMDTSNIEENKSRKSNDLSISQTIGSDQKKKKKAKIDTSQMKDGSKLMDTSNIEENKSRKSNDLNISQTIGTDQKKKKKKIKIDTSQTEKDDKEDSYTNLSFETEKIKQKQDFGELVNENVEKLLNESELSKIEKFKTSIECSTPKINISKQKICDIKKQDSSERNKNLTFKEKQNLKKLDNIKINESLVHRSLPSELIELTTETNLSRPMSSKVLELNKETLVSKNKTSITKYLKKEKLNESAPTLKLNAKSKEVQLIIATNSSIQSDQNKTENENKDKQKMKATADVSDSLKRKLLKVAGNILESDRHKKHKKRKQLTFEDTPNVILSRNDFKKDNDSLLTKTTQQFVPITNIDNNNEIEKENKKRKKKKKERDNIDVQMQEKINKEIETKPESRDKKVHDEVKKKKKKEKEIESVSDLINEKSKVVEKEKKISSSLPNENVSTDQPSKKKHRKQKLLIKDDVMQHGKVSVKKVPEERQKLSSDILHQNENTYQKIKKLSEEQKKQLLESNYKKQQLKDAISESDEGPETITFSKARDDVMVMLKRTADSIKANKETKKKKQKEHTEKMQKQKETKIKELKSKNQITESKMKEQGKGVKRLANDVLENLSDVPLKSMKKRRVSEKFSTVNSKPIIKVKNMTVEDDFLTLPSCSGSTTQFSVIDIQTIKKSKKVPRTSSFREKMLARNSRQPVSAYLMYLKKQENLGKQKFYDKPY